MKTNYLIFLFLVFPFINQAQTLIFAELTGSPTVNTTGWNLTGATYSGDTGGDANLFSDEIVLTDAINSSSGGIFYNQSIDLSTCYQWKVEFDFRMWEGSAADGIAFCFLDVPPTGFVSGGGVGIPASSNGVFVILDTYDNGCGANPEIQIYQGTGYNECGAGIINRATGLNFLRSNNYQTCRVEYNSGLISVFINNTLYLTGNYNASFVGYMGFTASTGGSTDKHSIKNARIFADIAVANAGSDVTICSGGTAQLGAASNSTYTYNWTGSNLSSTTVSNPTVTLTNNTGSAITQTFNLQTTLSALPSSCPDADEVIVTVNPVPLVPTAAAICSGQSYTFQGQTYSNPGVYTVMTTDAQGCQTNNELTLSVNPNLSSIVNQSICQGSSFTFNGQNFSNAGSFPVTLSSQTGCDSVVTLNLTVNPAPVSQLNESICAGGSFTFGSQNLTQSGQYSQTLQTIAGCDSIVNLTLVVNPVITATQNTTICQGQSVNFFGQTLSTSGLYSQTLQTVTGCDSIVNLNLLVNPLPSTPTILNNGPVECPGDIVTLSASSSPNAQFEWSGPQNFSSQGATVSFEVDAEDMGDYAVIAELNGCFSSPAYTSVSIINIFDFDDYDFPNVITPNGDGINDTLDINGYYKTCQEYNLLIYSRWGHLVYEQNISSIPFSGKSTGDIELLDGIYFYKLSFGDKTKSGFLHLIR
jgi:gliding motility-associated-like protein